MHDTADEPLTRSERPPRAEGAGPERAQRVDGPKIAGSAVAPPDRRPFYLRPPFIIFAVVAIGLAIAGGFYYVHSLHFEETDDAFIDGHVVPISPQISALVAKVYVSDNAEVHKGDPLVDLDPTDFQVAIAQARGAEASTRGKLEQARSGVPSAQSAVVEAQAELDSATVNFDNANQDLKRFNGLDPRARSQQQLDNATSTQKRAQADVEQAKAKVQTTTSQVLTAQANVTAAEGDVQKAQADTRRAEVNLGYCRILAPCDGRVTNKSVDVGMYVTSATQLLQVVPAEVWVTANYKETQLTNMRPGQPATIYVDAYPEHEFHGTVNSIQSGTGSRFSIIPAENATGNFVKVVQRVPVKITFDDAVNGDPTWRLSPGMSVEAKVKVR